MNFGSLLVYLQPLLVLATLAAGALHLWRGSDEARRTLRGLLAALLVIDTLALALLAWYFINTDLGFACVADDSSADDPLHYRLSGVWAGREGTLLLWSWAALLALNLEARWQRRAGEVRGAHLQRELTLLIGLVVVGGLTLIQLTLNPFAASDPVPPAGRGLEPLLMSPWMVVHPPVVFLAYGLVVPVFAAGLAYLVTGHREWNVTARRWGRWAWLSMGAALALGGYWAYVTLGWGGYWGWDPVETSSLLPWISLTAFLHASHMFNRKGSYRVLGPLLGTLTFVLVLFGTFVTRGGVWVSVHDFVSGDTGGAWSRFGKVLADDPSVRGFFALMILALTATTVLTLRAYSRWPQPAPEERRSLDDYINEETTFYAAIYFMLLVLVVTLVLLLMGVNGSIPPATYETRLALFLVPLAALFVVHTLLGLVDTARLTAIAIGGCGASLMLAALTAGAGKGGWMMGAALPWLVLMLWALGHRIRACRGRAWLPRLRKWAPHVIHLGVLMVVVGYAVSYGLDSQATVELAEGETVMVDGYELTLERVALVDAGDTTRLEAEFTLRDGDREVAAGSPALVNHGGSRWNAEVFLQHAVHRDIYVSLRQADPDERTAQLTVRTIPGVMLVWTGVLLNCGGMLLLLATEWRPTKRLLRRLG